MLKDKNDRQKLLDYYSKLHNELKRLADIDNTPDLREQITKCQSLYYEMRQKYNDYIDANDFRKERSMIFYWITRTCFNGLIRYNPKGHFNASFHVAGRFGILPERLKSVFESWANVIDGVNKFGNDKEIIIFMHCPPITKARIISQQETEFVNLMKKLYVKQEMEI